MESEFQFSNPSLLNIEYEINEGFAEKEDKNVKMEIQMAVQISEQSNNSAVVRLTLQVGNRGDNYPYFISCEESARFKWNESISDNMRDKLLNQNAPALLLSYLRPVVFQVTAASLYGPFNIPFMNFTNNK